MLHWEQIVCTQEWNIYRLSALTFCLTLAIIMQRNDSLVLWKSRLAAAKPVLVRVQAHRRGGGGAGRLNDIYIPLSRIFYFFLF